MVKIEPLVLFCMATLQSNSFLFEVWPANTTKIDFIQHGLVKEICACVLLGKILLLVDGIRDRAGPRNVNQSS